jgi:hypothetical protein
MKPFQLLPQLALVIAVVYACSDSTSPANARSSLSVPGTPALGQSPGESPPPPIETSVYVCTAAGCAYYSGTYFSNGSSAAAALAAAAIGDLSLTFSGTAWQRIDKALTPNSGVSANARFKVKDMAQPTGTGTFMINNQKIVVVDATTFTPNPNCGLTGELCAHIVFSYTIDGGPVLEGGQAFSEDFDQCVFIPPVEGSGAGFISCPEGD